ncbi:MAG: hypothetical protein AAF599_20920, partial [Bacteroidota bacterium]
MALEVKNNVSIYNNGLGQGVRFDTGATLALFKQEGLVRNRVAANEFGLYSLINMGRNGKAHFSRLQRSRWSLKNGKNSCEFTPNGKVGVDNIEINTEQIKFQKKICGDALQSGCWQKILGTGNNHKDLSATEEGREFMRLFVLNEVDGITNDFYAVADMGQSTLLELAKANQTYLSNGISHEEFNAFYNTVSTSKGHLTHLDELGAAGSAQHNVQIDDAWVSGGEVDSANVTKVFDRLIAAQSAAGRAYARNSRMPVKGFIKATSGLFTSYEDFLIDKHNGIPETFYLQLKGASQVSEEMMSETRYDILMYKGYAIMDWGELSDLDKYLGYYQHRAVLTVPGALGIA